jgi:hypothetical protein
MGIQNLYVNEVQHQNKWLLTVTTNNKHFTILGLTVATGEPLLCLVIFASKREGKYGTRASGIYMTITPNYDDNGQLDINDESFGNGNYLTSSPSCYFCGKNVPCLPLLSPNVSITGELAGCNFVIS